jgi:hypothetical protein
MKTVMGVGTIRLNSASAQFSANFNKVVADAETSKRFGHAIDRKALGNRRNTLQAELLAQLNSVGPAKKQALPRDVADWIAAGFLPVENGRVEMWRGGCRPNISVVRLFRLAVP